MGYKGGRKSGIRKGRSMIERTRRAMTGRPRIVIPGPLIVIPAKAGIQTRLLAFAAPLPLDSRSSRE